MWRRWVEGRAEAAWYGGALWSALLLPLSALVGWVVNRRRDLFLKEPPPRLGVPVVVVGGLTVGGTGKSPVLIALAHALGAIGLKVAVVSRGYGAANLDTPRLIDPDRDQAGSVGDEPLMIAQQLGVPVVVCAARTLAVRWVADHLNVDVVLSDDGLQHYAMARDYEIVVLDGGRGLGNGRLLPAGPLREPASRLDTVDWVLERNGHDPNSGFNYRVEGVRRAGTHDYHPIEEQRAQWHSRRIAAITGLGQPEQFFAMLENLGLAIHKVALADHEAITTERLKHMEQDIILVTAKDETKLPGFDDDRIWVVEVTAQLPTGLVASVVSRINEQRGTACSTS